jgi:hypothetical protein
VHKEDWIVLVEELLVVVVHQETIIVMLTIYKKLRNSA